MPQEKSSKVYSFNLMKHGIQTGNLSNVITNYIKQATGNICFCERSVLITTHLNTYGYNRFVLVFSLKMLKFL